MSASDGRDKPDSGCRDENSRFALDLKGEIGYK